MGQSHKNLVRLWISSPSGALTVGEEITGGTSGAKAKIAEYNATYLMIKRNSADKDFTMGETITGGTSTKTAVIDGYEKVEWGHIDDIQIEARRLCATALPVFQDEDICSFGKEVYIGSKEQNTGAGTMIVYSGNSRVGWTNESGTVTLALATAGTPVRFNYGGQGLKIEANKSGGTSCDCYLEINIKRVR